MKVKDLITELSKLNPETEVCFANEIELMGLNPVVRSISFCQSNQKIIPSTFNPNWATILEEDQQFANELDAVVLVVSE